MGVELLFGVEVLAPRIAFAKAGDDRMGDKGDKAGEQHRALDGVKRSPHIGEKHQQPDRGDAERNLEALRSAR